MSWGIAAVAGATIVGGYLASENSADAATGAANIQASASDRAAGIQADASQAALDQRQKQFDVVRGLLQPWVDSGLSARSGQEDLLGLRGPVNQSQAIDMIKSGPAFSALKKTGENAILSNSAATGGLRGGNVEGALAQYDENLLSALIDQQYGRLTGVSGVGANAAAGVGSAATNMGNGNAGDIVGAGNAGAAGINNAAAANAGGILGVARADNMFINSAVNAAGVYAGNRPPVNNNPGAGYSGGLNPATGTSFGPTFANG